MICMRCRIAVTMGMFNPEIFVRNYVVVHSTYLLFAHLFNIDLFKDRPGSLFQPGPGPGSAKSAGTGILPGPGL